jgi:uncharacterized RDD family membrane protein YckC
MEPNAGIDAYAARYSPTPLKFQAAPRAYAGFWRRFFAYILDGLICLPFLFALQWALSEAGLALAYVTAPAYLAYAALFDANGGTIGKRAFGIRVIDESGDRAGYLRGLLRHPFAALYAAWSVALTVVAAVDVVGFLVMALLGGILVALLVAIGTIVDGLWMLGDPQKQTLHDKLAGTFVVQVR